ncbi:MAG TPA: response regulator [Bacteroidota bacterium]
MAQRKKILLVDDELSIALVLKGVITDQGYNVEVAHSGEEALEALKKSDPDLLITDIKMPGMDGFELIRTLQNDPKHKNLKYVILTAFNDQEAIAKAKKDFGIEYYIVKPFDLADVEAAVAEIMQKISP